MRMISLNLSAFSFFQGLVPREAGGGYSLVPDLKSFLPLTTHPFRDGTPFLLLIELPPTLGRSLRCYHIYYVHIVLLILPPSCFTARGHHNYFLG